MLCDPNIGFPSLLILDSPPSFLTQFIMGYTETPQYSKHARCWHLLQLCLGLGRKSNSSQHRCQTPLHPIATPGCTLVPLAEQRAVHPYHEISSITNPRKAALLEAAMAGRDPWTRHTAGSMGAVPSPLPPLNPPPGYWLPSQATAWDQPPAPQGWAASWLLSAPSSHLPFQVQPLQRQRWVLAGRRCDGQDACPEPQAKAWRRRMKPALPGLAQVLAPDKEPFLAGGAAAGQGRML